MQDSELYKYLNDIVSKIAELSVKIDNINNKVEQNYKAIYGNGNNIGLKTQVYILWGIFIAICSMFVYGLKILLSYNIKI